MANNFCSRCGSPVEENSRFCTKCGNRLVEIRPQMKIETAPIGWVIGLFFGAFIILTLISMII